MTGNIFKRPGVLKPCTVEQRVPDERSDLYIIYIIARFLVAQFSVKYFLWNVIVYSRLILLIEPVTEIESR